MKHKAKVNKPNPRNEANPTMNDEACRLFYQ
jgi:hypothetical protein